MNKSQALEAVSRLIAASDADAQNERPLYVTEEILARGKEAYTFFLENYVEQHQSDKR